MSKHIHAVMVKDWTQGYEGNVIPRVLTSSHPRFPKGTRLDWGFIHTALKDGYSVQIDPLPPTLRKGCE